MSFSFGISASFAERLRDDIRDRPLRDQEIRKIVGMDSYYITAATTDLNEHDLTALFYFTIDSSDYVVVAALGRVPEST